MNRKKNKALSQSLGPGHAVALCLTSRSHVSNKMSTKQLSYLFGNGAEASSSCSVEAFNLSSSPAPATRVPSI